MITQQQINQVAALVGLIDTYRVEFTLNGREVVRIPAPNLQDILFKKMREEFAHGLALRTDLASKFVVTQNDDPSRPYDVRFYGDVGIVKASDLARLNELLMTLVRIADRPLPPAIEAL